MQSSWPTFNAIKDNLNSMVEYTSRCYRGLEHTHTARVEALCINNPSNGVYNNWKYIFFEVIKRNFNPTIKKD